MQKTLAELGAQAGSGGCSQCAPAMGVTERPVSVTSQGGVSAESACELPPYGRSIGSDPSSIRGDRGRGYRLRLLWCVALSCGDNGDHSDRMKSHAVPARVLSRASAVYKAMPKGPVTRRIREAVSGSADLWDGSRAVVASLRLGGVKRETVLSEQTEFGVDMGKLAARLKPPIGPPGPLSGNPAHPLRNVPQYPPNVVCGSVETGDSHVQNH